MGTFLIFASLSATYIGPGWTLGMVRDGFSNGMFLALIAPIAGISLVLVAIFLVPIIRTKFSKSFSMGDIAGGTNSHNHVSVRILVGAVNVILLSSVAVAMSYAGGELINNVFGFPKLASIAIMTAMVTVYSLYGGIRATIQTDAIQFIHFVVLIPILVLLMIFSEGFEWSAYTTFATKTTEAAFSASDFTLILGTALLFLLGNVGLDGSTMNRFLASKNKKVARNSAVYAGSFIFFWLILMVFIGSVAAYLYPNLGDSDQILLFAAEKQFPTLIYGIFIIAMIGVVMSTQDSVINASSSSFSQDILEAINPKITDDKKLLYSKMYTIALGVVAIVVASFLDSVLNALMAQLEIYIPIMVPIIFLSIVKKQHYWQAAIAGMIGGLIGFFLWRHFGHLAIPSTAVGLAINCIAYLLTDHYFKTRGKVQPTT